MTVKKISKGNFTSGFNLSRFKTELISANINGQIISIDDNVTNVIIHGDDALNNTADIKTIDGVVAVHDGTPDADSALDNLTATTDPTTNDDINAGYSVGSRWINTTGKKGFLLVDSSSGSADWKQTTSSTPSAGSYMYEPFHSGSLSNNTIGKLGWRTSGNGSGNGLSSEQQAGHPGIVRLAAGTQANGRRSIMLGQSSSLSWILSSSGVSNDIEVEWLIKFSGSIIAADLEIVQLGLFTNADATSPGIALDGIGVTLDPSVTQVFRIMSTTGGTRSFSDGTTMVTLGTWYHVSMVYTDTGSGGSLQLKVNGSNEGSPITTNFPTVALLEMAKIDSPGGSISSNIDIDRMRIFYMQNEED